MKKEQFFKAIDNVDNKLLKGVFDPTDEKASEPESKHGAAFHPARRSHGKMIAVTAACLAVVVGAGAAVKAGVLRLPIRDTSVLDDPANAADNAENNSADNLNKDEECEGSFGIAYYSDVSFTGEDEMSSPFSPNYLEITEQKTITATLTNAIQQDPIMPVDNIPYCLYVFADGKPIEYAPSGTDDYALRHDYSMNENDADILTISDEGSTFQHSVYSCTVNIDFDADEHTHIINFVCCYYPDTFQPRSWLGFTGTNSAMAINTAYMPINLPETKQLGEYTAGGTMLHSECYVYFANNGWRNEFMARDLMYSAQNDTFLIEYSSGNTEKVWYDSDTFYLILLIDGKLRPAFGGEYSYLVDCENGEHTFKYEIPSELLPTNGNHTIQCIAIPADECEHSGGEATPRIRISALD